MISRAMEDYLKVLSQLHQENQSASTNDVALAMGVSPASATNMLKKLADTNLVIYTPYRGASLTKSGEKAALEIIRHHRLLELYLNEALGVPWDEVHEEAEKLEHVISEELEERIANYLGNPTTDPHGHPIPARDGSVIEPKLKSLADLQSGETVTIKRVPDKDPNILRYLGELRMRPGTKVHMLEKAPFNGPLTVKIYGEAKSLGAELAAKVFVGKESV